MRERDRETDRQTGRQRKRQTERDSYSEGKIIEYLSGQAMLSCLEAPIFCVNLVGEKVELPIKGAEQMRKKKTADSCWVKPL